MLHNSKLVPLSNRLLRFSTPDRPIIRSFFEFLHQRRVFRRWQEIERKNKEYREIYLRKKSAIPLGDKMYLSPEKLQDVMPKKMIEDQDQFDRGSLQIEYISNLKQMRYLDHSFDNIRRSMAHYRFQKMQFDQRFLPDRLLFLGPDLAAAHFIVHRHGSVKFVGDDRWHKREGRWKNYQLPGKKIDGLYLEAIDASGTELMFEGFDNLYDLEFLRLLSLRDCRWTDDWVLSRIGGIFYNSLEMLDLSNCNRISAKGLLGLRSLTKLRFLRLEGLGKVEGIAKSALLLEEALPNLTIIGLDYDHALSELEQEEKLLSHDRVLIDAKGNAFVEDDNGRLFYVKGSVSERVSVCDADNPLWTSTIRRELPKMEPEEFEELNMISRGKLRHLLVGSPSGYSWNEQVETILSHEEGWYRWDGIPTDLKMLPRYKRTVLLEERRRAMLAAEMGTPKIGGSEDNGGREGTTTKQIEGKEEKEGEETTGRISAKRKARQ